MNVRFNVQSYYAADTHFPYKSIWCAKASKKNYILCVDSKLQEASNLWQSVTLHMHCRLFSS